MRFATFAAAIALASTTQAINLDTETYAEASVGTVKDPVKAVKGFVKRLEYNGTYNDDEGKTHHDAGYNKSFPNLASVMLGCGEEEEKDWCYPEKAFYQNYSAANPVVSTLTNKIRKQFHADLQSMGNAMAEPTSDF